MGLSRLIDLKASAIPAEQISVRLDVDLLAYADEVAEELGVPRAEVIREAFRDGMRTLYGDWQTALRSANTGGKKLPGGKK